MTITHSVYFSPRRRSHASRRGAATAATLLPALLVLCLSAAPELLRLTRLEPMTRGRFARLVQVVARSGELGDLGSQVARLCARELRDTTFPPLIAQYPWLAEQLTWHA